MISIIRAVIDPFVEIFVLTVVEPLCQLSTLVVGEKRKSSGARYRHPAPSVFRTIRRQQIMVSPPTEHIPLLPENVSVTAYYVRLNTSRTSGEQTQHYIH